MTAPRRGASGPLDGEIAIEWDEPSGVRDMFDDVTPTKATAPELLAELRAREEAPASPDSGVMAVADAFDDGGDRPTFPVIEPELFAMASEVDLPPVGSSTSSMARRVESPRHDAGAILGQLGGPRAVVHQALLPNELARLALDPRAAFVVSLADGATTIDDLLDLCGIPREDALRILADLAERRILHFEDP